MFWQTLYENVPHVNRFSSSNVESAQKFTHHLEIWANTCSTTAIKNQEFPATTATLNVTSKAILSITLRQNIYPKIQIQTSVESVEEFTCTYMTLKNI